MKINMYEGGGNLDGNIDIPGGSLTGPLLLSGNVNSGAEAVHKQYIDTEAANVNANGITTGTLSAARMPAFTGDAVSSLGSTVFTLNNTGVVNGDYSKVTVDAKGLVTSGGSLVESDVPNFDWSKITLDKPTTLLGYGITDALNSNNGVVTGQLTLNSDPVDNNDLATKQYVDSNLSGGSGLVVGDIINTSINITPTGFLRCNGGEVSKTEYSALYSIIGDAYSLRLTPGSGQPWRQQYLFNTVQTGDITGWMSGTSLPGTVYLSQAIVTKSRVYLLGGINNGIYSATVYTAPINEDGTLGTWTTGTSLPGTVAYSQAIVTKSRVYLLGGVVNGSVSATVYTAPINEDGTLGTWTTGTSLPGTVREPHAIVTKSRVYLLGGHINGSDSAIVYTAPINEDGTLGAWTTGTSLPGTVTASQAIVTKNRVYLLGGVINGSYSSTVYTAPINEDGTLGTWTTGTSLPGIVGRSQAIVTKNRVYLLGGHINGSDSAIVYTAPINEDGTLGTWTTGTSLPGTVYASQAIVTKSRVYLLGGYSTTELNTVYQASFSGGLNDYTGLSAITPTDPNNFRLPDYTLAETSSLYFYIKA